MTEKAALCALCADAAEAWWLGMDGEAGVRLCARHHAVARACSLLTRALWTLAARPALHASATIDAMRATKDLRLLLAGLGTPRPPHGRRGEGEDE